MIIKEVQGKELTSTRHRAIKFGDLWDRSKWTEFEGVETISFLWKLSHKLAQPDAPL